MKETIVELLSEGKTKAEVARILDISKSTVTYYCSNNRESKVAYEKKRTQGNSLIKKAHHFRRKKIVDSTKDFQRRSGSGSKLSAKATFNFTYKDVLSKFGEDTICYLSGEKINLINDRHYNLDHITPPGKGGDNSLENVGITHKVANMMKQDLSIEELLEWCKKILEHNGYKINKES